MGIAERKEREKTERKALIMNCAKELILERGAEQVSMQDIAKKAELSKATLYLYFPSKDELFGEICNAAANQFMEAFQARFRPDLRGIDIVKLFWNCYLDMYGESDDMIIIFSMKHYLAPYYPILSLSEKGDALMVYEIYSVLKDALSRGVQDGSFDPGIDTAAVAKAVLALFSTIIEDAVRLPRKERNSKVILEELRKLFEIMLKGIACEGLDRALLILPSSCKTGKGKNA